MIQENSQVNADKVKILIAEDNATNMLLVKCILENILPHATIWGAEDGLEAIKLFPVANPDLIFMDISMPHKSGYDATKEIRQLETKKRTPIIALTAGTAGNRDRCLNAGMDDYIEKPVIQDSIANVIRKWLPSSSTGLVEKHKIPGIDPDFDSAIHFDELELRNRLKNREELLRAILQASRTEMDVCLDELYVHLKNEDFRSLKEVAHKLKGMALSACFNLLANLAAELEALNETQNKKIKDLLVGIDSEVKIIKHLIKSGMGS